MDNFDLLDRIHAVLERPHTASYVRLVAISEIVAAVDVGPAARDRNLRNEVDETLRAVGHTR